MNSKLRRAVMVAQVEEHWATDSKKPGPFWPEFVLPISFLFDITQLPNFKLLIPDLPLLRTPILKGPSQFE